MNPDSLSVAEATDDLEWDRLVDDSPQGTVFSRSAFLQSLGRPFRRLVVTSGGAPAAMIAVMEDGAGNAVRVPFTPYQGILFAGDERASARQRVQRQFVLTESIVRELTRRYPGIGLSLSWKFEDIRPFLWHNHGRPADGQFIVRPRYTAVLDLGEIDEERYPREVRQCRRQELKKAAGYSISEDTAIDDFLRIYASTFARQGIALDDGTLATVRAIAERALHDGYGRLSACETPAGIASMNLFLYDAKRAYYLFAANEPELRHSGGATRLMFDNIFEARRRGLRELDFVGVNSPARGDFKLSFNPDLKLYFELDFARPSGTASA